MQCTAAYHVLKEWEIKGGGRGRKGEERERDKHAEKEREREPGPIYFKCAYM